MSAAPTAGAGPPPGWGERPPGSPIAPKLPWEGAVAAGVADRVARARRSPAERHATCSAFSDRIELHPPVGPMYSVAAVTRPPQARARGRSHARVKETEQ